MPDFIRTSVTTTAQSLDGSQSGLVTRNGGIYSDGAAAVNATAGTNWLTNDGYIYAFNSSASAIEAAGSIFNLFNGADGIITDEASVGGVIDAELTSQLVVNNHGLIHSSGNEAIKFDTADTGSALELDNHGTISAGGFRAIEANLGNGWSYITNSGSISAESNVIDINNDLSSSGFHTLINSGSITAKSGSALSYAAGDTGTVWFTNSGEVSGATNGFLAASSRSTDFVVTNSGLLQSAGSTNASYAAIRLFGGTDAVINTGTIIGDVELGDGNDEFDGRGGTLVGQVEGGDGNDVYRIDDAATVIIEFSSGGTDTVFIAGDYALADNIENLTLLGADAIKGVGNTLNNTVQGNDGSNRLGASQGNDTVFGIGGDDSIYGGGGNDNLDGGEGDDYVSGGSGADTILGGDGDDVLHGRRGFDSLNGGDGNDLLTGGTGNDTLLGGQENDTLVGGDGADNMNGGGGSDTFVWNSAGESTNDSGRDIINSFEIGLDLLDVSGLAAAPMVLSIGGGLAGVGTPSLRTFETSGGDTRIYIDVDGDNGTDMRIDLIGVTGVTGIDFIL